MFYYVCHIYESFPTQKYKKHYVLQFVSGYAEFSRLSGQYVYLYSLF